MAKSDNMLAVLWLLRSKRRMTASQLSEALETSVRTVYRYIDALCASGVPVIADAGPDGGYSLPDHFRGAPLLFEPRELIALFQAARFAERMGLPDTTALQSALEKVRHNLSGDQVGQVERHLEAFRVYTSGPLSGDQAEPLLKVLDEAVANCVTVRLLYQKPEQDEPESRQVDPYALAFSSGFWYVLGYCHLRRAQREFRLDRIHAAELTGATFTRPPDFEVDDRFSDAWIQSRLASAPERITLRLGGEPTAVSSTTGHWYLRYCLLRKSSREAEYAIDPAGLDYVRNYLLRFGRAIRVLEPRSLREEVRELAAAYARHHAEEPEQ